MNGEEAGFVAADVEGTLTSGETWRGLLAYLRAHGKAGAARGFLARMLPRYALSRLGLLDRARVRRQWIEYLPRTLRGLREDELRGVAAWVVDHELWPKRRPDVLAELERHARAGHAVVLCSGVYQPVLEALAARLGAQAIGTPLEVRDGRLTGELAGAVCTGHAKAQRLCEHLQGKTLFAAYGDTLADVPMLKLARNAVAVYPEASLAREAEVRGWRLFGSVKGRASGKGAVQA